MVQNLSQETVLDVTSQQVAKVYAKGFLGAAESAGQLDALVEELGSLIDDVWKRLPDFAQVLSSRLVSPEDKKVLLDRALGNRASPTLLNFLKVLATHYRLDLLPGIRRAVVEEYRTRRGRVEVIVHTAKPLDDALLAEINKQLESRLTAQPQIITTVQPDLLGGVVIRIGDTVYDGSVATRLRRLRLQMVDRTVQEIERGRERFLT